MKCHRCSFTLRKAAKYCDECGCPVSLAEYLDKVINERVAESEKRAAAKLKKIGATLATVFCLIVGTTYFEIKRNITAGLETLEQKNATDIAEAGEKMRKDISARFENVSEDVVMTVNRFGPSISGAQERLNELETVALRVADRAQRAAAALAPHETMVFNVMGLNPISTPWYTTSPTPPLYPGNIVLTNSAGTDSPGSFNAFDVDKYIINSLGSQSYGRPSWLSHSRLAGDISIASEPNALQKLLNSSAQTMDSFLIPLPSSLTNQTVWTPTTPVVIKKD